jgi:hypothetical protein
MRCASVSFYAAGAKLRPSQVSIKTPSGSIRPASVRALETLLNGLADAEVIAHTDFGDLVLPFSARDSKGRLGRARFATPATLHELQHLNPHLTPLDVQRRYLAAVFAAHPADVKEWPSNAYSRKLLRLARTTFADGRNLFNDDQSGYDTSGFNRRGFDEYGIHRDTGTRFDPTGFDFEHLSVSGLERPRSWWDEELDVNPLRAAYEAASASPRYELARNVTDLITTACSVDRSALTLKQRADLLSSLGDEVVETALRSVRSHLSNLSGIQHVSHDDESPLEHGLRVARWRDDDELDLDIGLVSAAIARRLTGRFRAQSLPPTHLDTDTLEQLAGSVLVHVTAAVLSEHRRASHPSSR